MATTVDPTTLDGLFKEVYADRIENLVPEATILQKRIAFSQRDSVGNKYHQPVVVTAEHGFTYAAADAGAFTINTPVAHTMKDATLQGSQILLASRMSYDAAHRASTGGKKAFVQATEHLFRNMVESMARRVEIALLYGGSGIGQSDGSTNSSSTVTVVDIVAASWAPGIWTGAEGAVIEFFNGASQVGGDFTISAVDVANKKLTVTGSSGDISTLDTSLSSNTLDIYFNGAYGNEMSGLNKILTNTGSLFGISAATYSLWGANAVTASGALTFKQVLKAVNKCVARGLMEPVVVLCSPATWTDLSGELAALRQYDNSYKSAQLDQGAGSIMYHGTNGSIEIVSHPMVKEGDCFVVPMKRVKRLGATDITFNVPGNPDNRIFIHLQSNAGFEVRSYTDQAIILDSPAKSAKITGFTNS